jgi:hypothetical protein
MSKHIYANLLEPKVCSFLALGVLFSPESLHFSKTEKIFQLEGQTTAASQRYCGQLAKLFKSNAKKLEILHPRQPCQLPWHLQRECNCRDFISMENLPQPPLQLCTAPTPTAVIFGTCHQVLLYHPE